MLDLTSKDSVEKIAAVILELLPSDARTNITNELFGVSE